MHLYFRDGRLRAGDELLMVNGKLLVGLTHQEAVATLRSTTGLIQLLVASMVRTFSPSSNVQLCNSNNKESLLLQGESDLAFKCFPFTSLPDLVSTCNLPSVLLETASSPKHHTFTSLHDPEQVYQLFSLGIWSENCVISLHYH